MTGEIDNDSKERRQTPFFDIDHTTPKPAEPGRYERLFLLVFGGIFLLAGVGILGLQVFTYLYDGFWVPFSLIDLSRIFSSSSWLTDPQHWIGVHNILSMIPASLALVGVGIFIWNADSVQ